MDRFEGLVTLRANPQDREAREVAEHGRVLSNEPKTYDPSKVVVTWDGVELSGFADGAFLEVERPEDDFVQGGTFVGVDYAAPGGSVTVELVQTSGNQELLELFHDFCLRRNRRVRRRERRRARLRRIRNRGWA